MRVTKPKLYIETSIISYLTAKPSRDLVTAARQQVTREWWETRKLHFDLYISEFVFREARSGDPKAADLRLALLNGIPEIVATETLSVLAEEIMEKVPLPPRAAVDAAHIAAAVIGGMDYLLTWNFKHLANAALRAKIDQICEISGYQPCVICTPEELMEATNHGTR